MMKIHHVLTDGVGGMEMARYLFDLESEPDILGPMPDAPVPESFTTADLVRDALRHNASCDQSNGFAPARRPRHITSDVAAPDDGGDVNWRARPRRSHARCDR